MEYSPEVERRLRSPHRVGVLRECRPDDVTGEAEDRSLNVWVRFEVQLTGATISAVGFEAYGCPHFVAAADWLAERLEGLARSALREPDTQGARAALEVPAEKLGKLLVLEDALAACADAAGD